MGDQLRRFWLGDVLEIRAEEGKPPVISGYAAVFNAIATIGGFFREQVMPGAFARALREKQDVRALVDHNPAMIIGRVKAGTLKVSEDDKGLRVEIAPPDTTVGRDVIESIRRGDLDQMSFSFRAQKQKWIEEKGQLPLRQLEDVDLTDVSVVAYPAYMQTSVSSRSQLDAEAQEFLNRQQLTAPELVEVYQRSSRHSL